MKYAALLLLCFATRLGAQDTSYSELRFRLSLFRNPIAGPITEDWRPGTGAQFEVATPIAFGELGLAAGHASYTPTTGKPAYSATLFTLAWMAPSRAISRATLSAGVRLTDYRMDFDDPSLVGGLRTEEEVLLGVIVRIEVPLGRRFAVFSDGSYGVLMLGTHTPMALVHLGVERAVTTPTWIRDILR